MMAVYGGGISTLGVVCEGGDASRSHVVAFSPINFLKIFFCCLQTLELFLGSLRKLITWLQIFNVYFNKVSAKIRRFFICKYF